MTDNSYSIPALPSSFKQHQIDAVFEVLGIGGAEYEMVAGINITPTEILLSFFATDYEGNIIEERGEPALITITILREPVQ